MIGSLRVITFNCNRTTTAIESLVEIIEHRRKQENRRFVNILCLQECPEPMPLLMGWNVVHPNIRGERRRRTAICIPEDALDVDAPSTTTNDLSIIRIGNTRIINIYQPPEHTPYYHNVLDHLRTAVQSQSKQRTIIVGDFNAKKPEWSSGQANWLGEQVENLAGDLGLVRVSQDHVPTYPRSGTTIDLVYVTENLMESIEECFVDVGCIASSDHLPVTTIIATSTRTFSSERRLWKYTDWRKFNEVVSIHAPQLTTIDTAEELEQVANRFTNALIAARNEATPIRKSGRKSAPWWHPGLQELHDLMTSAYKHWDNWRFPDDLVAYKYYCAKFRLAVKLAKQSAWKVSAEQLDRHSIWRAIYSVQNGPANGTYGDLHHGDVCAKSSEQKVELFASLYFPNEISLDRNSFIRMEPSPVDLITRQEVLYALQRTAPLSAPGPDGIPAIALKSLSNQNLSLVQRMFNASIALGSLPSAWKHGRTVVLKKPSKSDYSQARSFRPITMLPTVAKLLEKIMATRLRYLVTKSAQSRRPIVSPQQFGFLPQRSCEQATVKLTEAVRTGWDSGLSTTAIFLDIQGAYDNVIHDLLLEVLRQKGIPGYMTNWFADFLHERRSTLCVEGCEKVCNINIGLPQGSPASPVLYTFYNTMALDILGSGNSIGYADDMICWCTGTDVRENCRKLQEIIDILGYIWCRPFQQKLDPGKSVLMHFSPPNTDSNATLPTLIINEIAVPVKTSTKYLGTIIDDKLDFGENSLALARKGSKLLGVMKRLGTCTWGPDRSTRLLAIKMALLPTITFSACVWMPYVSAKHWKGINSIYRKALLWATGAIGTTKHTTLLQETGMMPLELLVEKEVRSRWVKWCSYECQHPISQITDSYVRERLPKRKCRTLVYHLGNRTSRNSGHNNAVIPLAGKMPWDLDLLSEELVQIPEDNRVDVANDMAVLLQRYEDRVHIYTDGSKSANGVGAAWVRIDRNRQVPGEFMQFRFDPSVGIYQAEAQAIIMALLWVRQSQHRVVIFSDSLSNIKAAVNPEINTREQMFIYQLLKDMNGQAVLHWIPGHSGILGNDVADHLAKEGAKNLLAPMLRLPRPVQVQQQAECININLRWMEMCSREFQTNRWNPTERFVYTSVPSAGKLSKIYSGSPNENVLLTRLRSNHIWLGFYANKIFGDNVRCACGWEENVGHMLLRCPLYRSERWHLKRTIRRIKQWSMVSLSLNLLLNDPTIIPETLLFINKIRSIRKQKCPWMREF